MSKDSTTTISVSDWDPISINIDDMINTDGTSTITIDTSYDVNLDWMDEDYQLDLDLETLDDKFPAHIAKKLKAALEEVDKDLEKDNDVPF